MHAEPRRRPGRLAPLAAALLLAAVPLAGCGRTEEKNVRRTVEAFYGAVAANQGDKACARLAPEARAQLERGGKKCPDVIRKETGVNTRASAGTVTIREKRASAAVNASTLQGVVRLRKIGEAWRIVSGFQLR